MSNNYTRNEKMSDAFLVLGSQYYAHARYSAQFYYLPVCVTLFHHAIELLLKGFLSKRKSSSDLKKMGHNLVALWEQFKAETGNPALTNFDKTIRLLDQVELLRYPDSIVDDGFALHISLTTPSSPIRIPGTEELPQYNVTVRDLDTIAVEIFEACNVATTLYFKDAPTDFKNALPSSLRPKD